MKSGSPKTRGEVAANQDKGKPPTRQKTGLNETQVDMTMRQQTEVMDMTMRQQTEAMDMSMQHANQTMCEAIANALGVSEVSGTTNVSAKTRSTVLATDRAFERKPNSSSRHRHVVQTQQNHK